MSTIPDLPGLPESELSNDDDAVFDDLARRAGAALRRPAPEDGVRVIAHRRRRQQALKASVVGGVAVATLIGALVVVSNRDDRDGLRPVDSPPATLPTTTLPAPIQIASGEEISATPDFIHFGGRLVGVGDVAKEGGRTFVVAGHFDGENPYPDSQDLNWVRPETFVLAAFDDAGVELWRTELENGRPTDVVVFDGDLWVSRADGDWTLARIDASNGRILGRFSIGAAESVVGAFDSLWATILEPSGVGRGAGRLVRIDPDLSTTDDEHVSVVTTFDECVLPDEGGYCPNGPAAGAGAMWLPLGPGGVAMIDPDTNDVTVIPVDDIGHEVLQVAVNGDVAYVASINRVTSIVDGEVVATVNPGQVGYLGPVDEVFGVLIWPGEFRVLGANDPMVVETRQISVEEHTGGVFEADGEAWVETGRNYNLLRVKFLPDSEGNGG